MSNSAEAASRIRDRIAIGELPNKHANRLFIGSGAGYTCDACGEVIGDHSLEYQFEARMNEASRRLRFHDKCFQLWEYETEERSAR